MKIHTLIGLSFLFCSCSIKNNNIIGKYMSKNNPSYLQIRKNNVFVYEYRSFHLYQQSIGKWKNGTKGLIILNSEIKSTAIPLNVSNLGRINEVNNISIKLNITDSESLADYKCKVYINDLVYCLKRCDSLSSIQVNSPINNIYLMFIKEPQIVTTDYVPLPLTTNKYTPGVKTGNNLEVKVSFSDTYFYYKAFNSDTIKITRRGIKMFNLYKRKWEKILKVSDETNLFSRYNDKSMELNKFR